MTGRAPVEEQDTFVGREAALQRLVDALGGAADGRGGTVVSADHQVGQAGLMRRRPAPAPASRSSFAGFRFPPEVITVAVRWYLRYGLSYRDVEELLAERNIEVDRSSLVHTPRDGLRERDSESNSETCQLAPGSRSGSEAGGEGLHRLGGATRVGKFSEQARGDSPERRQGVDPATVPTTRPL
jgi:hypothetical protein